MENNEKNEIAITKATFTRRRIGQKRKLLLRLHSRFRGVYTVTQQRFHGVDSNAAALSLANKIAYNHAWFYTISAIHVRGHATKKYLPRRAL